MMFFNLNYYLLKGLAAMLLQSFHVHFGSKLVK